MTLEFSYGIIPFKYDSHGVKVLLIQHLCGHWAFPKGGAELNEHPIDTAQRELKEETNLDVKRFQ